MRLERYRRRRRSIFTSDWMLPVIAGLSVVVWGLALFGVLTLVRMIGGS